jgi:hypothetical protein
MLGLQITAKDVKASKIVRPGWYATKVTELRNETASDKESENLVVEIEGMEGDAQGVPGRALFSEKFPQSAVPFVNACGKAQGIEKAADEEKGLDARFNWSGCKGVVLYAQWGTWRGKDGTEKPRNNINDWAPLPSDHPLQSMNAAAGASVGAGFEA